MKNRKWVLASSTIVASVATIIPLTSLVACQTEDVKFEVYAKEQTFSGSNTVFEIPLTFSYTPKNDVEISLIPDGDVIGLKLLQEKIKIEDKKAIVRVGIETSLWESKVFKFGLKFNLVTSLESFELKGFYICYEFEEPKVRDKITLIGSRTISTSETSYKYKILFENKPIEGTIKSSQALDIKTSRDVKVTYTEGGQIVEEHGYNYFYFEIGFEGDTDSNLVISFDMNIIFKNTHQVEQDEIIYGCTMIYLHK